MQTEPTGHWSSLEQPHENVVRSQTPLPSQSESEKHGTRRTGSLPQ